MPTHSMHTRRPLLTGARAAFAILFLVLGAAIGHAKVTHPGIEPDAGIDLYGSVLDDAGAPVAGVVVSDGYQCVATDVRGVYQMKRHPQARMVYYSTPEDFAINTIAKPGAKGGSALFYAKLTKGDNRYNFDLARLPAPEKEFTLICVGDPQTRYFSDLERYKNETIADLREFSKTSRLPAYAILLGDVGFDTMYFLKPMRDITDRAGIAYFAVIGNHDHDEKFKKNDYKAGEGFENVFGPLNYSFNRGGVHIIGMDNILYDGRHDYKTGFTDEQVEWLRQSLSFVPKDKIIVLAYHAPLREYDHKNRVELMKLFEGYAEVHIMAGHTHTHENILITKPVKAYEHIHGTACGAWWISTLNTDGAPNGFGVFTFNGNKVADWYYKAAGYAIGHQMRMYRGDASFGGPSGTFSFGKTANDVIVDVWNADPEWKITAYENGVKAGVLEKLPRMVDAYTAGYHVGVLNRSRKGSVGGDGKGLNKHLYLHTKKDPDARVEIRATDRFGKTYVEREFTTDLSRAAPPAP